MSLAVSKTSSHSTSLRHCAFCLIPITKEQVKLCGKCHRRAYCSRTCQTLDWTDNKKSTVNGGQRGQGHKHWCSLNCGEEDIDWKVTPIQGKGWGLKALKPIPARSRIIVEAGQPTPLSHPGIKDLFPEKGTIQTKWDLNKLGCNVKDDEDFVLCMRISRANHKCAANAAHIYCNTFKVKILFAERDIAVGEEICVCYTAFYKPSSTNKSCVHQALRQLTLQSKFGITCPENCICRDPAILEGADKAMELDKSICELGQVGKLQSAMRNVKQLMTLHDTLHHSLLDKKRTLWDGFQVGVLKNKTLPKALAYLDQLVEIMGDILHPKSGEFLRYSNFKNDPTSHENYLYKEPPGAGGTTGPTDPEDIERMMKLLKHFTNINKLAGQAGKAP